MWADQRAKCNHIGRPMSVGIGLSALTVPGLSEGLDNRGGDRGRDAAPDGHQRELRQPHAERPNLRHSLGGVRPSLLFAPVLDAQISVWIRADRYASKYVPVHWRTVNREEQEARCIARGLKTGAEEAIRLAAPSMAALIEGPCWLVPVPASDGSLTANLKLATAIAALVPSARVNCAVARVHPVDSSCRRRAAGQFGLTPTQHAIVRIAGPMQAWPVYFVDNVITSGATIAACRRALGWGTALAYADAGTWRNTRPRSTG